MEHHGRTKDKGCRVPHALLNFSVINLMRSHRGRRHFYSIRFQCGQYGISNCPRGQNPHWPRIWRNKSSIGGTNLKLKALHYGAGVPHCTDAKVSCKHWVGAGERTKASESRCTAAALRSHTNEALNSCGQHRNMRLRAIHTYVEKCHRTTR